jgi:hypothetical protein
VAQTTKGFSAEQLDACGAREFVKLQRAHGAALEERLQAAAVMINQLEQKQPGLNNLLKSKGIGDNALVASMLIGHAAIYHARRHTKQPAAAWLWEPASVSAMGRVVLGVGRSELLVQRSGHVHYDLALILRQSIVGLRESNDGVAGPPKFPHIRWHNRFHGLILSANAGLEKPRVMTVLSAIWASSAAVIANLLPR